MVAAEILIPAPLNRSAARILFAMRADDDVNANSNNDNTAENTASQREIRHCP